VNDPNLKGRYNSSSTLEDEGICFKESSNARLVAKEERNRKIIELYLRAENTQEKIAELMQLTQPGILNIIENIKKMQLQDFYNSFISFIYNIWNLQKQDNDRKHFGAFPDPF